jgi:metal-sulfur cluster biosynthetic enzyme
MFLSEPVNLLKDVCDPLLPILTADIQMIYVILLLYKDLGYIAKNKHTGTSYVQLLK